MTIVHLINRKLTCIFIALILGIIILPGLVVSQSTVLDLDLARYRWRVQGENEGTVEYDENDHTGTFPNGGYYMHTVAYVLKTGLFEKIILANGNEQRNYEEFRGNHEDPDGYVLGIQVISKYPAPKVFVDGIESSITPASTSTLQYIVDPTIKADKMYRIYKKIEPWMHKRVEMYQFVNQYYGDFVIQKRTHKLTFDDDPNPNTDPDVDANTSQTVRGFYIVQGYQVGFTSIVGETNIDPNGRWFINHGAWWTSTMMLPSVVPGCDRNQLVVSYGWDGDDPELPFFIPGGQLFDDIGDPRTKPVADGNLLSPAYGGFALLHCDRSPTDKTDEVATNPYTTRINTIRADMWWYGAWPSNSIWNYFITPGPGIFEISPFELGTETNASAVEGNVPAQVWGGWDMVKDDSVTTVHTIGAGSISREEARTLGAAWAQWYQKGDVPEAYYDDPVLGNVLATDAIKNNIIARGKDSLSLAMQRAQKLWENDLECPHPYPSPDLNVTSGPFSITLEWQDIMAEYPNHEAGNVTAYRIYRKQGHFEDEFPDDAGRNVYWEMIKEIPSDELDKSSNNMYTYMDVGLNVGEDYHYAVTAVSDKRCGIDGDGPYLESSRWSNRSLLPAIPIIPGTSHLDSIVVVPNPYYIQGQKMNYLGFGKNRIIFYNLPPFCTLRIFNVTGDLIHTLVHNDGSGQEEWDQITEFNQYIASGVYILVVTDITILTADDQGFLTVPETLNDKAIVKFTIIR